MQHDYKPRSRSGRRKTDIPGWAWLLSGTALGLLVALIVYLVRLPSAPTHVSTSAAPTADVAPPSGAAAAKAPAAKAKTAAPAENPSAGDEETRFSFYTELPNLKVEVPPEPAPAAKPATPPPAASPRSAPAPSRPPAATSPPAAAAPVHGEAYILQLGSYRSARDAEAQRARVAALGFPASVQLMTVDRKETWHRVRVGPYQTAEQAQQVRDQLRRSGIAAVVLKLHR